jgi:hypothetical protein
MDIADQKDVDSCVMRDVIICCPIRDDKHKELNTSHACVR